MGIRRALCITLVSMMMLMMQVKLGRSDVNKDKQECASQLAGLATCLAYVAGQAKAPTPDCCTGLRQVVKDSEKCLCILIKDRNDPSLGLKINATLALNLPHTCHAPAAVSDCPALLHLKPNDPEAKVFTDFGKAAALTNTTSTSPASPGSGSGGSSAKQTSDAGKGKRWLTARVFYGVLLWCLAASISHNLIL